MIDEKACKYCGWKFPTNFLKNKSENYESVFCENCGTEVIKENENKINYDSKWDNKKKKKSYIKAIWKKRSPIDRVLDDSDFPLIFKENYIIVISRLIFCHIIDLKNDLALEIQDRELTEENIDKLHKRLSPITNIRIKPEFLWKLYKINIKEFETWLKNQQTKLQINKRYYHDFSLFLRWLIIEVFNIISYLWDDKDIPKFKRIIRDDLRVFRSKGIKIIENQKTSYSVFEFFRDLKREISHVIAKKINYRQISVDFMKMKSKWAINDIILRSKGDSDYIIASNRLKAYEKAFKSRMGKKFSGLKGIFEFYRFINLGYRKREFFKAHPNINFSYFEKIDSKEKAYWLGWLYAEGHLSRNFLRVEIGVNDGILIKRFVEDLWLNARKVQFNRRYDLKRRKFSMTYSIKIYNKNLREQLNNLGFPLGKKSDIIRFPDFSDPRFASIEIRRELEMAFVLGFFDGDGSHGSFKGIPNTPVISSKSKKFLQDIVQKCGLPSYLKPKPKYDKEGNFQGYYYLGIGAKFFMLLTDNYSESLPRKRVIYSRFYGKFLFTRKQLQKIVEDKPLITASEIANLHFNLTGVKISPRTVCDKLNEWCIERISKDTYYWQKTIDLRLKGWSLREIYKKEFKFKNWGTYSKIFFKRVFRNDHLISCREGDIHKRIEEAYKPTGKDR